MGADVAGAAEWCQHPPARSRVHRRLRWGNGRRPLAALATAAVITAAFIANGHHHPVPILPPLPAALLTAVILCTVAPRAARTIAVGIRSVAGHGLLFLWSPGCGQPPGGSTAGAAALPRLARRGGRLSSFEGPPSGRP